MSAGADPVVHGRRGPRAKPTNVYPHKSACVCEDKAGRPAPMVDRETGDCIRCGKKV